MAFCFTFGFEDFRGQLKGYEGVVARCHACGNYSAQPQTRWPFFTFCFVPVIPLSCHRYHELRCSICKYTQDLSMRPEVQPGAGVIGGNQPPPPGVPGGWNQGSYQMGPPPPGPGYQQGYVPPGGGAPMYK